MVSPDGGSKIQRIGTQIATGSASVIAALDRRRGDRKKCRVSAVLAHLKQ